jgi:hypothetical protein
MIVTRRVANPRRSGDLAQASGAPAEAGQQRGLGVGVTR